VKYYLDTEFDGHGGPLLSMALVRGGAADSLVIVTAFEVQDPWVRDHVVPVLHRDEAPATQFCRERLVGKYIREFICDDQHPVIIADSPVDIGRFCAAISTGEDGGWQSADFARMTFEVHDVDCYPTTLPGAIQHNAWWDAMALRHRLQGGATK
jgi:hypothetical protein